MPWGTAPTTDPKASFHQQGREGGGLGPGLFADPTPAEGRRKRESEKEGGRERESERENWHLAGSFLAGLGIPVHAPLQNPVAWVVLCTQIATRKQPVPRNYVCIYIYGLRSIPAPPTFPYLYGTISMNPKSANSKSSTPP